MGEHQPISSRSVMGDIPTDEMALGGASIGKRAQSIRFQRRTAGNNTKDTHVECHKCYKANLAGD
jgi:hypothetical protein